MTTPAEIDAARARLAAAGAALRERSREATLGALARVLDTWSAPGSTWQDRLASSLAPAAGFSEANVREGLAAALRDWTGDALRAFVDAELRSVGEGTVATGFESTAVVLAGSIPMPTMLSLLAPLLLQSPVLAKTASRDPVTAGLFRESIAAVDPALAAALEVVTFPSDDTACRQAFLRSPCVVATGSDESVARIERELHAGDPERRFVGYGHRLSLAVLDGVALSPEVADALALDTARWDQLGCLSPIAVFLVGVGADAADRFAGELARALAAAEDRAPRGAVPSAAAAVFRAEKDGAEMRRAAGADLALHADPELRWAVVREPDAEMRPAPLHRFLRIHPVPDRAGLADALAPVARHLAAVALAGFGEERSAVADELAALGASRVCAPGTLQTPPLGWHHDHQPLLLPIARLCEVAR